MRSWDPRHSKGSHQAFTGGLKLHWTRLRILVASAAYVGFAGWMALLLRDSPYTDALYAAAASPATLPLVVAEAALVWLGVCQRGVLNTLLFIRGRDRIALARGTELALVNTLGNFLPLPVGQVAKAYLVLRQGELGCWSYGFLTAYLVASALGASALVFVGAYLLSGSYSIAGVGLALPVSLGVLGALPAAASVLCSRISRRCRRRKGYTALRIIGDHWLYVQSLSVLGVLLIAFRIWVVARLVGINDLTLSAAALLCTGVVVSSLVTVLPAGIGIREGAAVAAGALYGVPWQDAAVIIGVDRVFAVVSFYLFAGIWYGSRSFCLKRRQRRDPHVAELAKDRHRACSERKNLAGGSKPPFTDATRLRTP